MSDRIQLENGVDNLLVENGDFLVQEQTAGDGIGAQPSALPFVQRRVIERTTGPAQVYQLAVDQNIARWMPAVATLLACIIPTSAAAKQPDSRYASQPNAAILPLGPTPPIVAQTIPAFQETGLSTRTSSSPVLDIRNYDWSTKIVPVSIVIDPVVAQWTPAFSGELASFRTPSAPSLDQRRYDWDTPESDWIQRTLSAPTVAQTSPAWTDDGGRTADRARLDVRSYDWLVGEESWISSTQAFTIADSAAVFADAGGRTADRSKLDVRRYDWAPEFVSIPRLTDPIVATWVSALADDGGRTLARPLLDIRQYDWVSGEESWIQATQTPQLTVAQMAPAWISQTQNVRPTYRRYLCVTTSSFDRALSGNGTPPPAVPPTVAQTVPAFVNASERTRDGARLDVFRTQSIPDIYGVPDDWITWVPFQDDGTPGRTPDRARLDVRAYEWSQPAWIFKSLVVSPPTVAQTAPAWTMQEENYRTAARPGLDVLHASWDAGQFRTPEVWAQWVPFQDDGSGFTRDRAKLDVRQYEWSQPAWIFKSLPVVVTTAQTAPAWTFSGSLLSARTKLDVRGFDWAPEPAWIQRIANAAVIPYAPVFSAELASFRKRDNQKFETRWYAWSAEEGWIFINLPPYDTSVAHIPVIAGLDVFPAVVAGLDVFPDVAAGLDALPSVAAGLDALPNVAAGLDALPNTAAGLGVYPDTSAGLDVYPNPPAGLSDVR